MKQLETMGVVSFISVGHEVDTERHEVMSQSPGKEDIIITEFEKGYILHDRVIRHAKVIVGNGEEI
jgi:molecular chaperone GrpE